MYACIRTYEFRTRFFFISSLPHVRVIDQTFARQQPPHTRGPPVFLFFFFLNNGKLLFPSCTRYSHLRDVIFFLFFLSSFKNQFKLLLRKPTRISDYVVTYIIIHGYPRYSFYRNNY